MSDPRKEAKRVLLGVNAADGRYAWEDVRKQIDYLLAYTDELEAELDRLRGHEGETCQDCGRRYSHVYRVPDDVWEKITPHPPEGGLLCIDCAAFRASEIGIELYFEGGKSNVNE